ncbi:hypothetical protein FOA43_004813 [Brettanomyces nanus]|uniref:Tag1-like fifth Ig-like domain-containing protein n=1 Tax=Eeniella nana TaxID=13502 RepID=A0A875RQL7_EENNA|nr:uncharacterized protein FOA43_004813 [Brettanomyces nanus]QPG77400.1 hypothetical protein FOA43_004813 [Brettanomyces nanus]
MIVRSADSELEPLISPGSPLSNYRSITESDSSITVWRKAVKYSILIAVLIAILFLFMIYEARFCVGKYSEAVIFAVDSASFGIRDDDLSMNLSAQFVFKYSRLDNWLVRYNLETIGWILGTASFGVANVIKVGVADDKVMNVLISNEQAQFDVDLRDNQTNYISLNNVSIQLDSDGFSHLINGVFEERRLPENLKVTCQTEVSILRVLPWINVSLEYLVSGINMTEILDNFEREVRVKNFSIHGQDDDTEFNGIATVEVPGIKELSFAKFCNIKSMNWDVYLSGCNGKLVKALTVANEEYKKVSIGQKHDYRLFYTIPRLSQELLSICNDSQLSPANGILSHYLNGTYVPIFISGSVPQNVGVPDWLAKLSSDIGVKLYVSSKQIPINEMKNNPVDSIGFSDLTLNIDSRGNLVIGSELQVGLDIGLETKLTDIDIPRVRGGLDICSVVDGGLITRFIIEEWCESFFNDTDSTFYMDLKHGVLDIRDAKDLGKKVNNALNGHGTNFSIGTDLDLDIDSDFVKSVFKDIRMEFNSEYDGMRWNRTFDGDLTLYKISFLMSDPKRLALKVDFGVDSPISMSLNNNIELMMFGVKYMDTIIGQVGLEQFSLAAFPVVSNVSMTLVLQSDEKHGKSGLEEMLGKYLSGISPLVNVGGGPGRCVPQSALISELFKEIGIPMRIPQLRHVGAVDGLDSHTRDSLFVLDCTLHIMSSEIELTVYNPVDNHEIVVDIIEGKASHDDTALGYISHEEKLVIPPGVYKTPRIPVTFSRSGLGADILRKALNGELSVETQALLQITIGEFDMTVLYHGMASKTKIRL